MYVRIYLTLRIIYSMLIILVMCIHTRRLVEGSKALTKLKGLETYNERPVKDAIVRDCGVVQPLEVLSMS